MRLSGSRDEWTDLEVDTNNLDSLNPDERAFAERVYGQNNVGKTRIYVLNPDYVKTQLKGKKDSAIARASKLVGFADGSWFDTCVRCVELDSVDMVGLGLRGVLKESAEGAAPKVEIDPFAQAYQTLLANPIEARKKMTPEIATGMSRVLTDYLSNLPKA